MRNIFLKKSYRKCDKETGPRPFSGMVRVALDWGIAIRIRRFPVQNLLGAQLGLGTQPRYEAFSDLWLEHVQMQWLILG